MSNLLEVVLYVVALLLSSVFLLDMLLKWKRRHMWKATSSLGTARFQVPILGLSWPMLGKPENIAYWSRVMGKNENVFRGWAAHRVYVVVQNAEDYALTLGSPAFTKKPDEYAIIIGDNSIMGQGIFSATNLSEWRNNRKLITPAFHFQILKSFIECFHKEAKTFADIVFQKMKEDGEVDVRHPMGLCTLDMITQNALGISINAQCNSDHIFIQGMNTVLRTWDTRICKPWMLSDFIFNLSWLKTEHDKATSDVRGFATKVILDRLEERLHQSNPTDQGPNETNEAEDNEDSCRSKKPRAFLDLLIDTAYEGVEEWRMRRLIENFRRPDESSELKQGGFFSYLLDKLSGSWLEQGKSKRNVFLPNLFNRLGNQFLNQINGKHNSSLKNTREVLNFNSNEDGDTNEKDAELKQITRQVRDEVVTIMIGGQETTASDNSFAVLMLALHQDVQEKVVMELEGIFGHDSRTPNYADLQRMEYLECVIQETLRLYPAIPLLGREAPQNVVLPDGKVIPKGATTVFFVYALHRDPRYYPNPDAFIPDRFLPENSWSQHPYSFVPFSAGPRNCIGQKYAMLQMKTVLSTLVRQFRILPSQRMPSMDSIRLHLVPTLRAKNGCWVRLEKRF